MRDHLKRLERLERETTMRREPIRVIRQIIRAINGQPTYDPTTARCGEASIPREAGESPEAFEARALSTFTGHRLVIG